MLSLFKPKTPDPATRPQLFFFNTESGQKELFVPHNPNQVLLYTCGPTVYDHVHIGNLRNFVFADILKRTLIYHGYDVLHTMNFTDFGHLTDDGDAGEDKIMKGLQREGMEINLSAMRELTDYYIATFYADSNAMRILPATTYARASDYVTAQIKLIETLEDKGYTYETSDGVYFDIEKFPAYGRLGKIDLNTTKAGARVEINSEKRHPADFAVWKKGDLGWDSRWGKGFPGWHIECSAMAITTLGKEIDLHTGGVDLAPIHHNAEIAQCECATGKTFVKYWLHSAFVSIEGVKLAKSLGNAITLRHLNDRGFSGDDYRYWLLTAHYRSPISFSWEIMGSAKQALFRLKRFVFEDYQQKASQPDPATIEKFKAHLADDLDTPGALALAWEVTKRTDLTPDVRCATLNEMDKIFEIGLRDDLDSGRRSLGVVGIEELPADIQDLIDRREAARIARNWLEADTLRETLSFKGYTVEDTPHGPKVTKEDL